MSASGPSPRGPSSWIVRGTRRDAAGQAAWLAGAVVVGFLVAFVLADALALPRNGFVLGHALLSGGLVAAYAAWTGADLKRAFARHPLLGLAAAAAAGAFAVGFVLAGPGSPGVTGAALVWAVVWLGAVYGAVDGLLLTVMPVYAAWSLGLARGWPTSWPGRLRTAALALVASLAATAAYHLGFPEFRGPQLVQPLIGNAVFTLSYLLSANAAAPVAAHVELHLAAVVYAYGTSIPLPPHH